MMAYPNPEPFQETLALLKQTKWAADNGCFSSRKPFVIEEYEAWLSKYDEARSNCLFATAPDVVGDATATFRKSAPILPRIREHGFKAAYVIQDGMNALTVDWDSFDVLFVGGTTAFKLSADAMRWVAQAKDRGKWAHMGRVNSLKRLLFAMNHGCDSVDGTYLMFGPDKNLPKLLSWLDQIKWRKFQYVLPSEGTVLHTAG
jgi:hypothetical protein